jgi:hypothetical protein
MPTMLTALRDATIPRWPGGWQTDTIPEPFTEE